MEEKPQVSVNEFINVFMDAAQDSKGARYVAKKLDMPIQRVNSQATYLRSRGIKLPKLGRSKIFKDDITQEEANALIERRLKDAKSKSNS